VELHALGKAEAGRVDHRPSPEFKFVSRVPAASDTESANRDQSAVGLCGKPSRETTQRVSLIDQIADRILPAPDTGLPFLNREFDVVVVHDRSSWSLRKSGPSA
jgi:hypothetical protein